MLLLLVGGMKGAALLVKLLLQTLQCGRRITVRRVHVVVVVRIAIVVVVVVVVVIAVAGIRAAMEMGQMLCRMVGHRAQVLAETQLQSVGQQPCVGRRFVRAESRLQRMLRQILRLLQQIVGGLIHLQTAVVHRQIHHGQIVRFVRQFHGGDSGGRRTFLFQSQYSGDCE